MDRSAGRGALSRLRPVEAKPGQHAEGELGVMFSIVYVFKYEEL